MDTLKKTGWIKNNMKSLNIDIMLPWEVGIVLIVIGIILILLGSKQSKKKFDDIDNLPITKPTTKILFGSFLCLFGFIQILPLLN